ncbi:MAG: tRNA (adenosine(37)-N6)-dimethylallyltransferase MiaA [bacterium]
MSNDPHFKKKKIIVILGPTASGKTKLAVKLAVEFNGEIVSADSRQVYRGMDIGTGKDLGEYKIYTPYHLIDIVSPKTQFSLAKYQKLAYEAIDDIIAREKTPILTGGTGLYIQAVVDGMPLAPVKPNIKLRGKLEKWKHEELLLKLKEMDPALKDEMIQNNKRRMIRYIEIMEKCKNPITKLWAEQKKESKYDCLLLGVLPNNTSIYPLEVGYRESLNTKIDQRIDIRLKKEKMVEEVVRLHKEGTSWKRLESFGLEYKFIAEYLQDKLGYNEMVNLLKIATRQFAKRQMTWFKRDKRIKWISHYNEAKNLIKKFLR